MLKMPIRGNPFFIIIILLTLFLFGCASHKVCPPMLTQTCSFCGGSGVHEYQTDFLGNHSSIMRCHKCKGHGVICIKFKDPTPNRMAKNDGEKIQ